MKTYRRVTNKIGEINLGKLFFNSKVHSTNRCNYFLLVWPSGQPWWRSCRSIAGRRRWHNKRLWTQTHAGNWELATRSSSSSSNSRNCNCNCLECQVSCVECMPSIVCPIRCHPALGPSCFGQLLGVGRLWALLAFWQHWKRKLLCEMSTTKPWPRLWPECLSGSGLGLGLSSSLGSASGSGCGIGAA